MGIRFFPLCLTLSAIFVVRVNRRKICAHIHMDLYAMFGLRPVEGSDLVEPQRTSVGSSTSGKELLQGERKRQRDNINQLESAPHRSPHVTVGQSPEASEVRPDTTSSPLHSPEENEYHASSSSESLGRSDDGESFSSEGELLHDPEREYSSAAEGAVRPTENARTRLSLHQYAPPVMAQETKTLFWAADIKREYMDLLCEHPFVKHAVSLVRLSNAPNGLSKMNFVTSPHCSLNFLRRLTESHLSPFDQAEFRLRLIRLILMGEGRFLVMQVACEDDMIKKLLDTGVPLFALLACVGDSQAAHRAVKANLKPIVDALDNRLEIRGRNGSLVNFLRGVTVWGMREAEIGVILSRHLKGSAH